LSTLSKRNVLVVDGDPAFRKLVQAVLAESGFDVITACDMPSAQAVLEGVDEDGLACVLVDYGLADHSGIELVEWLNQHYPALAPVMVTASPEYFLLERSLRARVCAFLGKPMAPAEFRRAVSNAASITAQRRAGAEMRYQVEHAGMVQKMELERMLRSGDVSLDYRFHPLHYSSGDFLAYERLASGKDVFVMSDAAGHDLHASVRSAYFQGMLSGFLKSGRSLPDALQDCNHSLLDQPGGHVASVSVSALQIHRGSGSVHGWNRGGPPPAFIDSLGWVRTLGNQASSPLGWFEDSSPALDRVDFPCGPIWMWTDGLDELAERLEASPISTAAAVLAAPPGETHEFLAHADDDVLVARIWPGISAGATPSGYEQPLIADQYGPDQAAMIDRLQTRWIHSLQLALPELSESLRYDIVLSSREAVLNALKHGCGEGEQARFQITHDASQVRVRVSDPGPGYNFDLAGHTAEDLSDPVDVHRGLILMHAHAASVHRARGGSEVTMEFPLGSEVRV